MSALPTLLAAAWLTGAVTAAEPRGTGHLLLCAEFNAGQVTAQSSGHRLHATAKWGAGSAITRSEQHFLVDGCMGSLFDAGVFGLLFGDRFEG